MLTAGRFSNDSNADGDKRADPRTRTHEHAVSRPVIDPHPGTYAHGHTDSYKYTVADTSSTRHECPNGDIHTDDNRHIVADACPHLHADSHKLAYADNDTTAYSRPDRHTFTHIGSH